MAYPSDLVRTKNWGTEVLTDADLEGQFDLIIAWVMATMHGSTGHTHTGGSNDSPKLSPANLVISSQATGDTLYASSATAWARLAKGTAYQNLKMNSGATAPEWADDVVDITVIFYDVTTGVKCDIPFDYNATILQVTLLADQSGDFVVDLWKDTYANFPPTDADSITASAPPTLSTATKSKDSTLTGWTTSITSGDIIRCNIDSSSTVTRVTMTIKVKKG
jgi:hypothetical protein